MLNSPRAVIAALGGTEAVTLITRKSSQVVVNWKRFRTLPASTYLELTEALRARRKSAPPSLWNQRHYRRPRNHRNGKRQRR
jgi:hypothetical protein